MAVTFISDTGTAISAASANTLVITVNTNACTAGRLVVVRVASDNLSATTPTFTCTDSVGGNTWTTHVQKATNATGAAGVAGAIICSQLTNDIPSGQTITINLSGAVAAKAAVAQVFSGVRSLVRAATTATSGASAVPSNTSPTATVGDLVLGLIAVESRAAILTHDTDTTNGSWVTGAQLNSAASGNDAIAVQVVYSHKIQTTANSTQTYNTSSANTDWVAMALVLQPSTDATPTPATIVTSTTHDAVTATAVNPVIAFPAASALTVTSDAVTMHAGMSTSPASIVTVARPVDYFSLSGAVSVISGFGAMVGVLWSLNGHILTRMFVSSFCVSYFTATPFNLPATGSSLLPSATTAGARLIGYNFDGTKLFTMSTAKTVFQKATVTAYMPTGGNDVSVAATTGFGGGDSANCATFSDDGMRLYIQGGTNIVTQWNLSSAWDITGMTHSSTTTFSELSVLAKSIHVSPDGTQMVWFDATGYWAYSLATPWDLSTRTLLTPVQEAVQSNGMWMDWRTTTAVSVSGGPGTGNNQYTFAWRRASATVTTAPPAITAVATVNTSANGGVMNSTSRPLEIVTLAHPVTGLYGLTDTGKQSPFSLTNHAGTTISADGRYFYASDGNNLYQYTMATPFDISTLQGSPTSKAMPLLMEAGLHMATDGTFLAATLNNATMAVYPLSTPFDITTIGASTGNINPGALASLRGVTFSPDGTKMTLAGLTKAAVSYTLATPYVLTSGVTILGQTTFPDLEAGYQIYSLQWNSTGSAAYVLARSGLGVWGIFEYEPSVGPFDITNAVRNRRNLVDLSVSPGGSSTTMVPNNDRWYYYGEDVVSQFEFTGARATVSDDVAPAATQAIVAMDAVTATGDTVSGDATAPTSTIVAAVSMDAAILHAGSSTSPAAIAVVTLMDAVTVSTAVTASTSAIFTQVFMDAVTASSAAARAPPTIITFTTHDQATTNTQVTAITSAIATTVTMDPVITHAGGSSFPAASPLTVTMDAVTASTRVSATPATVVAVVAMDAVNARSTVTAVTASITCAVTMDPVVTHAGATTFPATIICSVAMDPVTAAGVITATTTPNAIACVVFMDAVTMHAGGSRAPPAIACVVFMGVTEIPATTNPPTFATVVFMDAPTATVSMTASTASIVCTVAMDPVTASGTSTATAPTTAIPVTTTMDAPSASGSGSATAPPATIVCAVTMDATTQRSGMTAFPAASPLTVTMTNPAATGAQNATQPTVTIVCPVTMDNPTATGVSVATAHPAASQCVVTMNAPVLHAGQTTTPPTIVTVVNMPAVTASALIAGSTAPASIQAVATVNNPTVTATRTATAHPAATQVVTSMNSPILHASQTAFPATIISTVLMNAATLHTSMSRAVNATVCAVTMDGVTISAGVRTLPAAMPLTVTMPPPLLSAGWTVAPGAVPAIVHMDTPVTFGGNLPTPSDAMHTSGYARHRSTGGYLSPALVSVGYESHRGDTGYDPEQTATGGYTHHRKSKGYRQL